MMNAPMTADSIAGRVRAALEAADLDEFGALLSPDVHWGAPDDPTPPCRNRGQVLEWYRRGRAAGTRAKVTELTVHGDALLVGLTIARDGGEAERWQILHVGPEGVDDIRGFEDRPSAAARLGG
jgi:ketosteroid isomerase-like protein